MWYTEWLGECMESGTPCYLPRRNICHDELQLEVENKQKEEEEILNKFVC